MCSLFFTFSTVKEIAFFIFFYFFLTLPFFPYFPFLSTLFSHLLPLFFFSLSLTLTLPTIHPLTGAPFLSFHFRRARITPPPTITLLFYIIIYYYCLLLFYIKKKIKKPHPKIERTCIQAGPFSILSLFTRARYSPSLGRATLLLQSAQLSSSEYLLKKIPLKEAGSSVHLIFFVLHLYYYCRQVLR